MAYINNTRLYKQKSYFYKKKPMKFLRQIGEYLFIVKRDPKQERTGMMKAMHGMNRLSLLMFILALFVMLFKFLIIPYFKK